MDVEQPYAPEVRDARSPWPCAASRGSTGAASSCARAARAISIDCGYLPCQSSVSARSASSSVCRFAISTRLGADCAFEPAALESAAAAWRASVSSADARSSERCAPSKSSPSVACSRPRASARRASVSARSLRFVASGGSSFASASARSRLRRAASAFATLGEPGLACTCASRRKPFDHIEAHVCGCFGVARQSVQIVLRGVGEIPSQCQRARRGFEPVVDIEQHEARQRAQIREALLGARTRMLGARVEERERGDRARQQYDRHAACGDEQPMPYEELARGVPPVPRYACTGNEPSHRSMSVCNVSTEA